MKQNKHLKILGAAAACVVLCVCGGSEDLTRGVSASGRTLTIAILDVGHGDSSLIIFPDGTTMLVDAGNKDKGRSVVAPFLKNHGIEHLDYYVETHPHGDHVDGRPALDAFIDSRTKKWDWKTHKYEDKFNLGGTTWFITNAYDKSFHGSDANKNSLAFRIEYNGFVYSAGGDQASNSMDRLVRDHPDRVKAHVRNTAHHAVGPVSSSFLRKTDPKVFVVSAPSSGWVRSAYRDTGKKIYVTGRDGHVVIRASSGSNWERDTCRSRCDLGSIGTGGGGGGGGGSGSCEGRCSSSCKCGEGEGDCDSDSDCKSGLKCPQTPSYNPDGHDVCYAPGGGGGGHLKPGEGDCDADSDCPDGYRCWQGDGHDWCVKKSTPRDCTSTKRCGPGEGDCDQDSHCMSGLFCKQRSGTDYCVR